MPFDARDRLRRVRRRQAAARRRARRSSQSRGIDLPRARPTTRPCRDRARPRHRKNDLVLRADPASRAWSPTTARSRFVEAARDAGLRCAVVSSSTNCEDVLEAAGHRPTSSRPVSTAWSPSARTSRASPRRTRSWRAARMLGVEPARGRRVRGRAGRRAGRPGRAIRLGRRRRPHRSGRRAARARRRHRRRRTSPSCWSADDRARRLRGRARGRSASASSDLDAAGADRVGLRAVQRPHRPARQPRRGRAGRRARARSSTRSTRSARCRTPSPATAIPRRARRSINVTNGKLIRLLVDDEPFDVRYGDAASRTSACSTCAPACCGARSSGSRRRARRVALRSTRLVSFVHRSVAAIHYEVEPLDAAARGSSCSPSSSPTSPCPSAVRRPARGGRAARAARARVTTATTICAPRSSTARARAACGWRRRWTTSSTGPTASHATVRERAGPRARDDHDRARARPDAARRRSSSPTAGRASARSRRCATRSRPRSRRRAGPAGTACAAASASTSTTSGRAPTSSSTATPRCSRRSASRSSTCCRPARAAEQRAIPAKGLTGQRLRRPLLLGHGDLHAPGAHLHRARGRARRAALAPLHDRPGARARARARARRAPPSRGGRSAARSAPATGRRARRRSTSTPTSPTPSAATSSPRSDEEFERGPGLELLVATARLWRSLGHHDADGGFRIDGVTGPDEYTALVNNNVYTNLMAARNLRAAADARRAPPAPRGGARRRRGGDRGAGATPPAAMVIPYDEDLRRHPAVRGLHAPARWDFEATPPERLPAAAALPHTTCSTRSQVVKQADLVFALYLLRRRASTPSRRRATSTTTSAITVRDSSLSAAIQAIVAAEVGHLELAYDYFGETALHRPARPRVQHARRRAPRVAGRHLARRRSPASAACATTATCSASRRGCPPRLTRLAFRLVVPRPAPARRRSSPTRPPTSCSTASRSSCATTARSSRWSPAHRKRVRCRRWRAAPSRSRRPGGRRRRATTRPSTRQARSP